MEEDEQEEMLARAITDKNVHKIEQALAKTRKHGKGFVLTSRYSSSQRTNKQKQQSPKNNQRPAQPRMPIVIGSPIGSPVPSRNQSPTALVKRTPPSRARSAGVRRKKEKFEDSPRPQSAYITEYIPKPEKVDMAIQSDEVDINVPIPPPGTPEQRSESGDKVNEDEEESQIVEQDEIRGEDLKITESDHDQLMIREEPVGEDVSEKRESRISEEKFARLGIPKRPPHFKYRPTMPPSGVTKDPQNPEPLRPNVWITRVPKEGADVVTPFYTQVDVPPGALRGDVIMKFETQAFRNTKLDLSDDDKLCSYVVDVNMNPLTYCLHQEAVVSMRILEECVNDHENVTIVTARHFRWTRSPTTVEKRLVNGETHFFAVTKTQYLGKFAVITSRRKDRFVLTAAGGLFGSTILPGIGMKLEEGALADLPHMVEVSVTKPRQDALDRTSQEIQTTEGKLVASSPILDITKEAMGRIGLIPDGVTLPENVHFIVPTATITSQSGNKKAERWQKPAIKVMKRVEIAPSEPSDGLVEDFWVELKKSLDPKASPTAIQTGEPVIFSAPIPSQLVALIFDEVTRAEPAATEGTPGEICQRLQEHNRMHNVTLMVHQKEERQEIINVHLVPIAAATLISKTMEEESGWRRVDVSFMEGLRMREREYLDLHFRGGIQLTINQLDPQIQFHSRRWQGYQFQLESTDEIYSNCSETVITGSVEFTQKNDDGENVVRSVQVSIPYARAKPYRPIVIPRPIPNVQVVREYKFKWLKNLSKAEQEKYKNINTP